MHLIGERTLGVAILALLGMSVFVKRCSTGSVLEKPSGGFLVRSVNIYNLLFLLMVNPVVAIALIMRSIEPGDPTHLIVDTPWALTFVEIAGLLLYVGGLILMAWALAALGRSYQLGGSSPRPGDRLVASGPYELIRHPMYAAALWISLGLALLVQSWGLLCVFCVYLVLILLLIPVEERQLRQGYGDQYAIRQRASKRLVPFIY